MYFFRFNYPRRHNPVTICSAKRTHGDHVVSMDGPQRPEKRVSVRRDANVPRLAGKRRPRYVAGCTFEVPILHAFNDHNRDADARDLKPPDDAAIHRLDDW